ncbi:putative CCR4-associated factor [Abeliophyllum distichum]|uniref:CCR4-associated factor n=1 Tax=Abeliophyllum distichum TaxID=126358 RepID=A0ABD1TVT5_9LAMI
MLPTLPSRAHMTSAISSRPSLEKLSLEHTKKFLNLFTVYYGNQVYDVKHLMKFYHRLHRGLSRAATSLGLERVVGKCHQAASNSLLTWVKSSVTKFELMHFFLPLCRYFELI